jgi:signal transduction histidine kinase
MDAEPEERAEPDVRRFAAAVAHELRTPLSALSGEVEVALRRERTPETYRDILARVGDLVAELVDLTGDLAAFANVGYPGILRSDPPRLSDCVATNGRYEPGVAALDDCVGSRRVVGDQAILARAIGLLMDHAVRHRPDGAAVRIRNVPSSDAGAGDDSIVLAIEAVPGFAPQVWSPLPGTPGLAPVEQAALLRLPAAAGMIHGCGGSVDVRCTAGSAFVRIQLRAAQS